MLATGVPSTRVSASVPEVLRPAESAGEVAKNLKLFFQGINLTSGQLATFGGSIARFGSAYGGDARNAIGVRADFSSRATAFMVEIT